MMKLIKKSKGALLIIKRETFRVIPVFLFFLVFFTLINWTEAFLFERAGITPFRFIEVVIAAALIAKVMLVGDKIPFVYRFRKRPLVYGILWKTAVYWIILLIIRLLIRLVPFLFGTGLGLEGDFTRFLYRMNWNLFISVQMYYLMLLFIFITFQELTHKIGSKRMRQLFFGS
ncbi:MAG: hypothetical protein ABSA17_05835 [Rhabdochlamydiaceae bacterium]